MNLSPRKLRRIGAVLIALIALGVSYFEITPTGEQSAAHAPQANPAGVAAIAAAFDARRSDVWVEAEGRVARKLADDNDGSRHQRFLVDLSNGLTILIAHNIDLAPYVPLQQGDVVRFRGEYEWNDKGGVVHWTHHDPKGRRGGWIRHGEKTYE